MVRSTSTNYTAPSFPKASVDEDIFDAMDVQQLAAAVDGHDHSTGKGLAPALANASVTNTKLASDTSRASLLVNGGFELWQRGAGPFTAAFAFSADGWLILPGASNALSVNQSTGNADVSSARAASCSFTFASGDGRVYQTIKATEARELFGRTVSFSIRVKTATANCARATISSTSLGVVQSGFHTGDGTYQTLTVTATIGSADTAVDLGVRFYASSTIYLDNAMLVMGSVAADYAPLHPADDLARCQRYYELTGTADSEIILGGYAETAGRAMSRQIQYKATKAATPTVTKVGTWFVANCAQPVLSTAGTSGVGIGAAASATGWAHAITQGTASGQYVSIEANP